MTCLFFSQILTLIVDTHLPLHFLFARSGHFELVADHRYTIGGTRPPWAPPTKRRTNGI